MISHGVGEQSLISSQFPVESEMMEIKWIPNEQCASQMVDYNRALSWHLLLYMYLWREFLWMDLKRNGSSIGWMQVSLSQQRAFSPTRNKYHLNNAHQFLVLYLSDQSSTKSASTQMDTPPFFVSLHLSNMVRCPHQWKKLFGIIRCAYVYAILRDKSARARDRECSERRNERLLSFTWLEQHFRLRIPR